MTQNDHIDYIPTEALSPIKHQWTKVQNTQLLKNKIQVKHLA